MIDLEKYETNKSVAARDAKEFVPKLVQKMGPWTANEAILDYGCGAGSTGYKFILPHVEKHDSILYSVDVSDNMVDFAKKNWSHSRINYAVGNIVNRFPFEEVKFDKIFSIYVFHFVPEIRKTLSKLLETLKPGGRLGCTFVWTCLYFRGIRVLGESEKWKSYMKGYDHYMPEWTRCNDKEKAYKECKSIFKDAGYNIVELNVTNRNFQFDNIEILLEFYMSLNPNLGMIPEHLHPEFKEDFRKVITTDAGIPVDSKGILSKYLCVVAVLEKPLY